MPHRTYSEAEIAALIERAASLQAEHEAAPGSGLTLAELEEVAGASGIDPKFLRAAAAEHQAGAALGLKRQGADATHVYVERVLPGELDADRWEDAVADLRHRFDTNMGAMWGTPQMGVSSVEQIGRSYEWKHTSMAGVETRVMVRPRDGQMHLRLSQRVGMMSTVAESVMYGALAAAALGAGGGALLFQSGWGIALGFVLVALLAIPLVYKLDLAWRGKKHHELRALADDLGRTLAAPAPLDGPLQEARSPAEAPLKLGGPRLELADEDPADALRGDRPARARARS